MNKRNTVILALLFVILVVEIIVIAPKDLGLNSTEEVVPPKPVVSSEASSQIMKDVRLVQANPNGREWELWAKQARRPKEHEKWTIEEVKVKFFADDGVVYTVTGRRGNVIPEKNDMHIEGDVETRSSNGYVFRTDSVSYDSKKRVLVSPHEIQMTGAADDQGGRLNLTGTEMMADFGTNDIRINQNVRAKRPVRSGDKNASGANGTSGEFHVVTIQSQRAVFSGRTNLAQFFGNVVIDVETMRLTGPEAKFSYDPKTRSLNSVTVSGGTRVTDTDKFATSGTVEINLKDSRVVFTGDPRVVQNGDELTGDRIVLSDGGKKVEVSNAKAQIDPKRMESH